MTVDKKELLHRGDVVGARFCEANGIPKPAVTLADPQKWAFGVCAYYRPDPGIVICLPKCSHIGTAGRAWSFPGYVSDRTPYGVIQHELGHHFDWHRSETKGPYFGDFSVSLRGRSGEKPITSYCPNDAEWFAECFRLFVTNPDLLRLIRPRTHRELIAAKLQPVFTDTWRQRLDGAPLRTIEMAARKIDEARGEA